MLDFTEAVLIGPLEKKEPSIATWSNWFDLVSQYTREAYVH